MLKIDKTQILATLLTVGVLACASAPTAAAVRIEGQVQAGGAPLANSTVTLWSASAGQPRQLAQARTNNDGGFEVRSEETPGTDVILYLVAKGGEGASNRGRGSPATAMLLVLSNAPSPNPTTTNPTTVLRTESAMRCTSAAPSAPKARRDPAINCLPIFAPA